MRPFFSALARDANISVRQLDLTWPLRVRSRHYATIQQVTGHAEGSVWSLLGLLGQQRLLAINDRTRLASVRLGRVQRPVVVQLLYFFF